MKPAEEAAPLSRTERFPPSEAHTLLGLTKTSQRAYEQEHNISSKAVILSSHLLTGRVSNEADPAAWSVVGLQDDASRRKFSGILLAPHFARCLTAHSSLKRSIGKSFIIQAVKNPA